MIQFWDGHPGHLIKNLSLKQNEWNIWLENNLKYLKIATIQSIDKNIHRLAVEIVEMDLLFIKSLKVILTKRFVLIKLNQNFKRKYDDKQFKYKIISSLGC